ncbi:polysaccharide pyruvyl transferase family protein [Desulfoluna butyratoxydans]|uniref:Polysaccharide pyruvyl transferase n=1 Tax=Desulfoluna butyratoxydans TaxID=231438 RepID=A0A4U8YSR7_9BACT|nr:polysaccharide pyruvyl transferase family protein [Desulfoluna butyratoxydans]VFQ46557.1 polysaccharide pyruvyl transferase [Desulfoluna butyratoxydans]
MINQKRIIFYKTTAAFDNTGEVLIYKSLLEQLRPYGQVIVNDRNKKSALFLDKIGIEHSERLSSYSRFPFVLFLIFSCIKHMCTSTDVVFVTGVGEHRYTGVKASVKILLSACYLALVKLFRGKVVRIGMSIYLSGFMPKFSERLLSMFVDHYYVRDSLSQKMCADSGIQCVDIAPDLSWAYEISGVNKYNLDCEVTTCLFSFRSSLYKNDMLKVDKLKNAILMLSDALMSQYHCSIQVTYQVQSDYPFAHEIYKLLSSRHDRVEFKSELITLDNALSFYGNAQLVFSNRLHTLLLACKYNSVPIGFIDKLNQQKIVGIFEDADLGELLLNLNDICEDFSFSFLDFRNLKTKIVAIEERFSKNIKHTMSHIFLHNG